MQLGVNVPNFGPGTDPGVLREWAWIVEGLGFGLLMVSDIVVLDLYHGDPEETHRPRAAWQALTAVATHRRTPS